MATVVRIGITCGSDKSIISSIKSRLWDSLLNLCFLGDNEDVVDDNDG